MALSCCVAEVPSFAHRHPPLPGGPFPFAAFVAFCGTPIARRLSDGAVHTATFSPLSARLGACVVGDDRTKPYDRGGGTKIDHCRSTTDSNHFSYDRIRSYGFYAGDPALDLRLSALDEPFDAALPRLVQSWFPGVIRHCPRLSLLHPVECPFVSIRGFAFLKPKTDNQPTGSRAKTDTQPIPIAPLLGCYRLLSPITAKPRFFPPAR
jgi:hypothetical protein